MTCPAHGGVDRNKRGTRFVRTRGGKTWTVEVAEQGYLFEGRRFASLSHITREITDAHWSGPRFFGIHSKRARVIGDA